MAQITLDGLGMRFGDTVAVDHVDLTLEDGAFVVLLGPSGCGKTTTLRCIAGLEHQTHGRILFDGAPIDHLDPAERDIAMVFQFFSLYPHMRVRDIISFPLRARKVDRATIRRKLDWVAEAFKLGHIMNGYIAGLPPGEKQKVALARAVVRDPKALLLDEPLSALDEKYREEMRWELGHLQRQLGVTTIYVTHDQREAMSLADRIVLMRDGRIVQEGSPESIYNTPATVFSGLFIGSPGMNFFDVSWDDGRLHIDRLDADLPVGDAMTRRLADTGLTDLTLGIRPEHIRFGAADRDDAATGLPVRPIAWETGGQYDVFSFGAGGQVFHGTIDRRTPRAEAGIAVFDLDRAHLFSPQSQEKVA